MSLARVREIAARVSNWGRWGADDERGTVNFITPEVLRKAAACVRRGTVFSLALPLGSEGPQFGQAGRVNPVHVMTATNGPMSADPEGAHYADDFITMPLQCATQWDSLAHVHYGRQLYNGHSIANVTPAGAARNGIDKIASGGIVSRGVLLDVARARGVERLAPGELVTPADLDAAAAAQRVAVESGDVLLLRTGHMRVFTHDGDRVTYMKVSPGIGVDCVPWLHARQIAALASDTNLVEVYPPEVPGVMFPVHMLCIRDMGLTLGEMFDLEALAEDCAGDGVYECLFTAAPLPVSGGVGSPINPLAVK
jgi:kynurenine formamidase